MKKTLLTVFFASLIFNSHAQEAKSKALGGEYVFNSAKISCITEHQRTSILETLQKKKDSLKSNRPAPRSTTETASFMWPLRQAEGFTYNEIWAISNYVDHGLTDVIDYHCGNRSYEGHMGTDIYTWPFSWKQMDDEQADIVAAEAGEILFKSDGYYDQSCAMNGGNWNAVYILHNDGSIAWYGHMKTNSLTTKNVGDMVTKGEFLGKVGSSGNSTGPHLHFEVYDADNNLIDPFTGGCNDLNTDSWWDENYTYTQPNINAVLTHTAIPDFNDCPDVETANISTQFANGDTVYAAIYMRDQEQDSSINLRVRRPDGSYLYNWNFTFETYYSSSYWYWSIEPDMEGIWTWEATYYGETVTQTFNVGTLGVKENSLAETTVYPNPTAGDINFEGQNPIVQVTITNMLGKTILVEKNPEGIKKMDISSLAKGMYFVTLSTQDNKTRTVKIVRE